MLRGMSTTIGGFAGDLPAHAAAVRRAAFRLLHRLVLAGVRLHTWCAADAVGISAVLGKTAHVTTSCGSCGRRLQIDPYRGELERVPAGALWLPARPGSARVAAVGRSQRPAPPLATAHACSQGVAR